MILDKIPADDLETTVSLCGHQIFKAKPMKAHCESKKCIPDELHGGSSNFWLMVSVAENKKIAVNEEF